ncbi:MAG: acyl-CoA dehydrogenase family protein [Hyphomicrobiaceae bacterium]
MPGFDSDERQLLDQSLQDFFTNTYDFEAFKKHMRAADGPGFSRAAWNQYAEQGWLGVALPEAAGGVGGGMTELAIVLAAAGRHLALEPFVGTLVTGAMAIAKAGTGAQQALLSEVVAGTKLLALCHSEPEAGYARDHVATIARKEGDGYVLSGSKSFALHAHAADTLVVSARLGDAKGPVQLFLVAGDADGVARNIAPALDGRQGATVTLDAARLDAGARLGDGDQDQLELISEVIDLGVLGSCAEAVGAMAAVTDICVDYLKTREQFGQPLSKFQVLQHRLVDMSVSTEEARASVHAALQAVDDKRANARRSVWHAKVQTARSARFVGGQGVQLHGGMGMTDELVVGHYYKRLAQLEAMFGDAEWYLAKLAAA